MNHYIVIYQLINKKKSIGNFLKINPLNLWINMIQKSVKKVLKKIFFSLAQFKNYSIE